MTNEDKCLEAMNQRTIKALEILEQIKNEILSNESRLMNECHGNWGLVGDQGHIIEQLKDILGA